MKLRAALLILLVFGGCKKDGPPPPKIEVCILAPQGGANCTEADGTHVFKTPSQMANYWATNPTDQGNFVAWCYETDPATVAPAMALVRKQVLSSRR